MGCWGAPPCQRRRRGAASHPPSRLERPVHGEKRQPRAQCQKTCAGWRGGRPWQLSNRPAHRARTGSRYTSPSAAPFAGSARCLCGRSASPSSQKAASSKPTPSPLPLPMGGANTHRWPAARRERPCVFPLTSTAASSSRERPATKERATAPPQPTSPGTAPMVLPPSAMSSRLHTSCGEGRRNRRDTGRAAAARNITKKRTAPLDMSPYSSPPLPLTRTTPLTSARTPPLSLAHNLECPTMILQRTLDPLRTATPRQ